MTTATTMLPSHDDDSYYVSYKDHNRCCNC